MGSHRFCSKADIKIRADTVSFEAGWASYKSAPRPHSASCTYSLETKRFYDGETEKDRRDLVETYGDGSALYIIAPWSNPEEELDRESARIVCERIVGMGYIPFIGIWHYGKRLYEEPSFAIDHGIAESEIREMLEAFEQKAVYRISHDHAESIDVEDL